MESFYKNNFATYALKNKKNEVTVLLSGTPMDSSIGDYIKFMNEQEVSDIFCFCELRYNSEYITKNGIKFHHLEFEDGSYPTEEKIFEFDEIIDKIFETKSKVNLHFHCHGGMGRAAIMLAYLMVSRFGYDSECVDIIRNKRRGAINSKQLNWILDTKKIRKYRKSKSKGCAIM